VGVAAPVADAAELSIASAQPITAENDRKDDDD